jgi:hypothetical protein
MEWKTFACMAFPHCRHVAVNKKIHSFELNAGAPLVTRADIDVEVSEATNSNTIVASDLITVMWPGNKIACRNSEATTTKEYVKCRLNTL